MHAIAKLIRMEKRMSPLESILNRLWQTLGWSNSWESWRERIFGFSFMTVALLLVYLTAAHLGFWTATTCWLVYACVLGFASLQGWVKLFGPVLLYDMIRTARLARYSIIRMVYGAFLFCILLYMALLPYISREFGNNREMLRPRDIAVLTEGFFLTFMFVQLVLVILLTPAYVAGAIADEKDKKTIDYLLATDLDNREIVLSKLVSRLLNITLLLLTGLPILSILQLLGGIDTELMISGFAILGLTMLGLASLGILLSTLFKKPRDAISLTYLLLVAYSAVGIFVYILSNMRLRWMLTPIWFGANPPTLIDAAGWINAGNPLMVVVDVFQAISGAGGRRLAAELPGILTRYAWAHLTMSTICIVWSVLRVRAIALKQSSAGTTATVGLWARFRPAPGMFPMLWKEVIVESRVKFNWLVWLAYFVLFALTIGTAIWIIGYFFMYWEQHGAQWRDLNEAMNIWFRVCGTGVGCLSLLMLAVRGATTITSERERDTFDALITSPLSAEGILFAKVVGNLVSLKPAWIWFGIMLLLALVTGGLHPVAVPIILTAWFGYAIVCTMIGMVFSVFCQSSIWSSLFSVLTTLILGGGHWIITSCCIMPIFGIFAMAIGRNQQMTTFIGNIMEYGYKFLAGVTPPFVFAFCSFSWEELDRAFERQWYLELTGFSILGIFLWLLLCVVIWFGILVPKFRHVARRYELIY